MHKLLACLVLFSAASCFAADPGKGLIIVTTEQIKNSSTALSGFIAEKEKRGFTVLLGTEKDFGGTGVKGQEKAILIREWLKTVYRDYSFLLLIGYPHTEYGDIPMVRFWSRVGRVNFPGVTEWADTDFFYADLTGNWDLNANSKLGEAADWEAGGVDFGAELIVGRMPVYFNDIEMLDAVLHHAVAYMNQSAEYAAYRKKFFMPAAIFGFAGMPFVGTTWPTDEDGATHMEWYAANYLSKQPDISITRMYEAEGYQPSAHRYDIPLTKENMIAEWNKGYGMVLWAGHGSPSDVSRTVWRSDANGNDEPDEGEIESPVMFDYLAAAELSGKYPSFVVAMSCDVGQSQMPNNLATHLLISGGAVGVVASSVAGPRSYMFWHEIDGVLDTKTFGDDNVGPLFFNGLIGGDYAGRVVTEIKRNAGTENDPETLTGKASFNYFGDPTLSLGDVAPAGTTDTDTSDETPVSDADTTGIAEESSGGCALQTL